MSKRSEPRSTDSAERDPAGDRSDRTAMADLPLQPRPCPMAAALGILGERWSLLALREMAYGVHRFDQIAGFTGASRDILADRLRKLETAGVIARRQYSEHPPRFEYHLTEAGEELRSIMLSLSQWGTRWAPGGAGESGRPNFVHECGRSLEIDHVCRHCGEPVAKNSVRIAPRRS